jgi:hypothetical protein
VIFHEIPARVEVPVIIFVHSFGKFSGGQEHAMGKHSAMESLRLFGIVSLQGCGQDDPVPRRVPEMARVHQENGQVVSWIAPSRVLPVNNARDLASLIENIPARQITVTQSWRAGKRRPQEAISSI